MMSTYIYSATPMYNFNGAMTGAHLYMEVKVFGGNIKPLRVYANSAAAAEAYLRDYARHATVGCWSISTIDARSKNFMVACKGDYSFKIVARHDLTK